MRRIFKAICLITIIMCFAGCNKSKDVSSKIDSAVINEHNNYSLGAEGAYSKSYDILSISEAGAIWSYGLKQIRFSPVDSEMDMALCYEPDCEHPVVSNDSPDPKCMAALYNCHCDTAYYDGKIYIFAATGIDGHEMYEMKLDGTGRKKIASFPFWADLDYFYIITNDKAYYEAEILQTEEDALAQEGYHLLEYSNRMVEVNLADGSYRFVTEATYDTVVDADLVGNILYMRVADTYDEGRIYVKTINIHTGEEKVIVTKDDWDAGKRYIRAYDEDSFMYWDRTASEIGIKNIDGTIEKVLLKGPEGERFSAEFSYDGMIFNRNLAYEDKVPGTYFMDLNNFEVIDITDEKDKYGIISYNGYCGTFIGEIYHKEEGKIDWRLWSKDKILSEAAE